jgi:hypothetical protein
MAKSPSREFAPYIQSASGRTFREENVINYECRLRQRHHRPSLRTQPFVTHFSTIDMPIPSIIYHRYSPGEGSPFTPDVANGLGHCVSVESYDLGLTKLLAVPPHYLKPGELDLPLRNRTPSHRPYVPHSLATMMTPATLLPTITQLTAPTKVFLLLSILKHRVNPGKHLQ